MNKKSSSRKPKKSKRTTIIVICVAVAVLAAAMCAMLIFGLGKKAPDAPDTETVAVTTVPVSTDESTESSEDTTKAPDPTVDYKHADNIKVVAVPNVTVPQYINPLTGEALSSDIAAKRPAAIMINNIHTACPQHGIGDADVMIEILAEGGITRLLMVKQDYKSLDVTGSVRSSRKYFIDMAQKFDALYIHAGGSDEAYREIASRGINNIDGVRGGLTNTCFYRDTWRMNNMGYEHSLMTTGDLITKGIEAKNYRTELKDGFSIPFEVVRPDCAVELDGESAEYAKITYRASDYPEYEFNAATGEYLRYQFQHEKHIDANTNAQLSFKNVLILVMRHSNTGDEKGHINVNTTGSGTGYYLTGGKYIPVNWSCDGDDQPMKFTDSQGNRLLLNSGKTAINIISPDIERTLVIK